MKNGADPDTEILFAVVAVVEIRLANPFFDVFALAIRIKDLMCSTSPSSIASKSD